MFSQPTATLINKRIAIPDYLNVSENDFVHFMLTKIATKNDTPFNITPKIEAISMFYNNVLVNRVNRREFFNSLNKAILFLLENPGNVEIQNAVLNYLTKYWSREDLLTKIRNLKYDVQKFCEEMIKEIDPEITYLTDWIWADHMIQICKSFVDNQLNIINNF